MNELAWTLPRNVLRDVQLVSIFYGAGPLPLNGHLCAIKRARQPKTDNPVVLGRSVLANTVYMHVVACLLSPST